ncbi:replication factor C subunit 3-like [Forsythia ovata]|uniref:Replication factor C subunit 3-like n=1 Tax=Forsythia ovata TaxID=205694 RepID=A0ABD1VH77_9LAMI
MPSPPIPCSKSAPNISTFPHSLSHSDLHKSVRSAGSLTTAWPKKLGNLITRKGSPSSKNAGLTEENLQEFNRRNAILETRYATCSPYYKGLTDFSLVINREKLSGSSPGRESHTETFVSSGSKSSFVVKVQKWSTSCYTTKKHDQPSSSSSSFWSKSSGHTRAVTSDSSSSKTTATGMIITNIRTKTKTNDSESEWKKVSFTANGNEDTTGLSNKEKPLSEREQELPPTIPSPTSPPQISSQTTQDPLLPPSPPLQVPAPLAQTPPMAAAQTPATEDVILKNEETKRTGDDRKYLWADNYRPIYLQDFLCNRRTALWLQDVVKAEERGHFIFEGLPGVGKRTMIWALLREAFGANNVQGEGVGSVLVNLMVSQQHIEVNLSELKGYEKHILVELIKERSTKLSNKALQRNHEDCKAIILYEADKISTDTLTYIKWILERFKGCNKVFFCCSDISKLEPVKSLCTVVQLLPPSTEEIVEVLEFIAKQEGIHLPHQLAVKFANKSNNNLRQAIRSFEATWHFK